MNRGTKHLLALSLLCLAAAPAAAQPATVRGKVVDGGSGRPLAGAVVHIGNAGLGVADAQGRFEVARLTAGEYTVWATAMGYGVGNAEIEVPFDSVTVTLALEPDPVRLAAVVATANRFDARTRAYPRSMRVFREEQLRTAASSDMLQFVTWRAGLHRVSCGMGAVCVMVRGRVQMPLVYIDEVKMFSGTDLLSTLQPWQVARVEVYRGGAEIRVYTRSFMDWAARTNFRPLPLFIGG